ncbi:DUF4013 domain-containing protein [Halapricum sp. CBA1109]|uniref:DUF4013 domain-containing protein n=1 Tax=Halapricum sp. CBA1109 TaxID=2668068 RepID=UPI0012FBA55E|nr:DUF4013 domain-containing protein [Halapricum sp. CBA1109]MUV91018.1 DUF4013 domain-containing protein [Halapricum sp. CBA1109]
MDIESAVRYPMADDDWTATILIGSVLTLLGFLIVPAFVVAGYLVSVARARLNGEDVPPAFDDWVALTVDGLKATLIFVVYMFIPAVVFAVSVGASVLALLTGSEAGFAAALGSILLGLLLSSVLALVFGYVAYVGLINFAREGSVAAGFDIGTITTVAFSADYFVSFLLAVVVLIAVGFVVGLLNVVPVLGTALAAVPTFYGQVVVVALLTDGFGEVSGIGRGTPASGPRSRSQF